MYAPAAGATGATASSAATQGMSKVTAQMISVATSSVATQLIEMRAGSRGHLDLLSIGVNIAATYIGAKIDANTGQSTNALKAKPSRLAQTAMHVARSGVNSLIGAAVMHTDPNLNALAANAIGVTASDEMSNYMRGDAEDHETSHHSAEQASRAEASYCAFDPSPVNAYETSFNTHMADLQEHAGAAHVPAWQELSNLADNQAGNVGSETIAGHYGIGAVNAIKSLPNMIMDAVTTSPYKQAMNSAMGFANVASIGLFGSPEAKAEMGGALAVGAAPMLLSRGAAGLANSSATLFSRMPKVGRTAQLGEVGFFDVKQPGMNGIPLSRTEGLGATSTTSEMLKTGAIPGQQGVILNQRVVPFDHIWEMSQNAGVEFILTKEKGGFVLRSGSYNRSPLPKGVRPILHTHPKNELGLNSLHPSVADVNVLNDYWGRNPGSSRPVSQILTGESEPTIFYATGYERLTSSWGIKK